MNENTACRQLSKCQLIMTELNYAGVNVLNAHVVKEPGSPYRGRAVSSSVADWRLAIINQTLFTMKYLFLLVLFCLGSFCCHGQTYSWQIVDDGCTTDTVQVMKWPDSVPSQFYNLLCFDEVRKMRIHSREINLELPNQIVKTDQFTQRHHNVGVYFTRDRGGFRNASLHEFGLGTIDFISHPKADGYYLVLSENNGRRRSVLYQMRRGDLIMYRSKTCEARIHKFPANGVKIKRT